MTLSFNLVLTLFLIAPGFAVYAAIFIAMPRGKFRSSPPPPNSIFTLSVVTFAALLAHTIWAGLLALQTGWCNHRACLRTPFDPDIYSATLAATVGHSPPSESEVAVFLATCLLLSVAAFAATSALLQSRPVAEPFRRSAYGWLTDLVAQTLEPNRYVTAFILTDIRQEGAFLGYEGLLENMTIGPDKQITALLLSDCNAFLLRIGDTVTREVVRRPQPIPRFFIEGAHIQNVAFNVFEAVEVVEIAEA